MKPAAAFLAVLCAATVAHADYSVSDQGTWPKGWPQAMEPLRKQTRSLRGSSADITLYEIPFTKRADFEAAWPHILKVKTKGAPVILVRSPDTWMGRIDAGVRIHCPPGQIGEPAVPGTPIAGVSDVTTRWLYTNYIELIVDGNIVDLNHIPLTADMLIIDRRFNDGLTAWGMEVDGLQAGLGYRRGEDRAYSQGETVKLVVRLRNVGKEEAKFQYFREFFYENPPIVSDADGKRVPVKGVMLSGWSVAVDVTLAPGKEIELSELVNLKLQPSSEMDKDMPWTLYETGKFQLQSERLGGYTGAGGVKLDAIMSRLATGKLELEVKAAPLEEQKVLTPEEAIKVAGDSRLAREFNAKQPPVKFKVEYVTKAILVQAAAKEGGSEWEKGHGPGDVALRAKNSEDKKQARFLAILTANVLSQLNKAVIKDVEKHFKGRTIRVKGAISWCAYDGFGTPPEVEILVDDLSHLEVID